MSAIRLIRYLHLAYFSKPVAERVIFRKIRKLRAGNLVVIGLDDCQLALKMTRLARQYTKRPRVRFTGIDLFEMRPDGATGLPLKQAHRMLQVPGARTQLVPGDPFTALARSANSLQESDLMVIRADQLARRWTERGSTCRGCCTNDRWY